MKATILMFLAATAAALRADRQQRSFRRRIQPRAALNSAFWWDLSGSSFSVSCAAAAANGKTLAVTMPRTINTATDPCQSQFFPGGKLTVNANQTARFTKSFGCPCLSAMPGHQRHRGGGDFWLWGHYRSLGDLVRCRPHRSNRIGLAATIRY